MVGFDSRPRDLERQSCQSTGGGDKKMKAPGQQKMFFPPEQTLMLRHVIPDRKELLENAIMAESPPKKLQSADDKSGQDMLLMYANYGSASETQRAKVE